MTILYAWHENANDANDTLRWDIKFVSESYEECVAWGYANGTKSESGIPCGEAYKPSQAELDKLPADKMTCAKADKLIKTGKRVIVRHTFYNETFELVITSRDRYTVTAPSGNRFYRSDLEIIRV